ncbi:YegS/Rv2252/BmrU family lipid kinase [Rhodobacteraceae bacterium RKSG542]|uniref:diacylglycerol/lipid kinase family protein n=1 Tax=Pseudovibrio flavus TaxID=2529854 RepID=UPI0012BC4547|nr:YegS/Rv2252/BmrU family lipid kinase [Pseudovibrio flavus]MTI18660.1 YegS/Rv2252/BmrU family lipid kinase [Pseudovibrio flavus]
MDSTVQSAVLSDTATQRSAALKVFVLANPTASHFRPDDIKRFVKELERNDVEVEVKLTRRVGEIADTCASSELTADVVVIAGGDGSVNEAAQALQERSLKPALAILPFGTANVLAAEIGLPKEPEKLAELILKKSVRKLTHSLANGRPFYTCASAGFDAEVVHVLPYRLKRQLGKFAFFIKAIHLGLTRRSSQFRVRVNNSSHDCAMVLAIKGKYYAGKNLITPEGSVFERGYHLVLIKKDNLGFLCSLLLRLWLRRFHSAPDVEIIKAEQAYIESYRSAAVQIDGEPFGGTPLVLESTSSTLPVIAPRAD